MSKTKLVYEAPEAEIFEVKIEGKMMTGSPWDNNNNTEKIDNDGDIVDL